MSSVSQILSSNLWSTSTVVSRSSFSASAGMPPGPGVFLFLSLPDLLFAGLSAVYWEVCLLVDGLPDLLVAGLSAVYWEVCVCWSMAFLISISSLLGLLQSTGMSVSAGWWPSCSPHCWAFCSLLGPLCLLVDDPPDLLVAGLSAIYWEVCVCWLMTLLISSLLGFLQSIGSSVSAGWMPGSPNTWIQNVVRICLTECTAS